MFLLDPLVGAVVGDGFADRISVFVTVVLDNVDAAVSIAIAVLGV